MSIFGLSRISKTLLTGATMLKDTKSVVEYPVCTVRVTDKASSRWRVSVAGSHGPAKPVFCRYREGKLVQNILRDVSYNRLHTVQSERSRSVHISELSRSEMMWERTQEYFDVTWYIIYLFTSDLSASFYIPFHIPYIKRYAE